MKTRIRALFASQLVQGAVVGIVLTVMALGGAWAYAHRQDHRLLHALVLRELQRQQAAQANAKSRKVTAPPPAEVAPAVQ